MQKTAEEAKVSFEDVMGDQAMLKFTRKQKRYQENKAKKQSKEIQKRNQDPKFLAYRVNQLQTYVIELVMNPDSELSKAISDAVRNTIKDGTV